MVDRQVKAAVPLHARPASVLAREIASLNAAVTLRHGDREANAKGGLSLLALAVERGDTVTIAADGPDEAAALEVAIEHLTTGPP